MKSCVGFSFSHSCSYLMLCNILIFLRIFSQDLINYYQSCSPRDRGLSLETARDRFFAVLVLVSALPVLVLASVLKCRS